MGASRARGATLRAAIWVLALIATISRAKVGRACSCGGERDRLDTDVIFQGKAVEVHRPLYFRFVPFGAGKFERVVDELWFRTARAFDRDVRTVFKVNTAWRGDVPQYVAVNTGTGLCCSCTLGAIFKEGSDYVVFAKKFDGELIVDWCVGSSFAGTALPRESVATLGRGASPASGARSFPMFWRHLLLPGGTMLPIALAGLIQWRFSGRRRRERAPRAGK